MKACRPSCCRVRGRVVAAIALGPQRHSYSRSLLCGCFACAPRQAPAFIAPSSRPPRPAPTCSVAAPAGRPLPKMPTPGRKMLRSGSAAMQKLTQMVGRSRQVYKVTDWLIGVSVPSNFSP